MTINISNIAFNGALYRNGDSIIATYDNETKILTYLRSNMPLPLPIESVPIVLISLETEFASRNVVTSDVADNAVASRIIRELTERNLRPVNATDDNMRAFILTTAKPRTVKTIAPLVAAHFAAPVAPVDAAPVAPVAKNKNAKNAA